MDYMSMCMLGRVGAVARAALAGFGLLCCLAACSEDEAAPDFTGTWLGTLHLGGSELRVAFNLEEGIGGYAGTMDVPDQHSYGIAVTAVEATGRHLVLEIDSVSAQYTGELADDHRSITGTFMQGGLALPLELEKQSGPLDHARPQDPREPFPYRSTDVTVNNAAADVTLACTLTWPMGEGRFDTVVLLTGSGPQNRDEEVVNHRPFAVLADALAREDIASLRCDDRGFGRSTGNFDTATSADLATDGQAQVAFLSTQPHYGVARIGLLGHSEGGLLAPMIADMDPDVRFLVLLAAPGVPGDRILVSQQRAIAAAAGASEREQDEIETQFREAIDLIRSTEDRGERETKLRAVGVAGGLDPAEANQLAKQLGTPWTRFFIDYDPAPVLRRTSVPVLALNGSLDLQVLPELNLEVIAEALDEAGNHDATTQILPGLNHLFQHANSGHPDEYAVIDETLAPEVLDLVTQWINARRPDAEAP